jgi:N-methylhydantoinase B/oxoprolinase/acetone carboxylase alpha subunit
MEKYEEIINSMINGQRKQAKQQLKKLTLDSRVDFFHYMEEIKFCKEDINYLLEAMITRDFK